MMLWISGLLFTSVLGHLLVGRFLKVVRRQTTLPPLSSGLAMVAPWEELTRHPSASGNWVGFFERIVLFWALYESSWEAVGIWILFKVAAKWEARNHLALVPEKIEHVSEVDWAAARRVWAAREYATFVVGTAANLLLAAGGVWIARLAPEAVQFVLPEQMWSLDSLDARCHKLLELERNKEDADDQLRRSNVSSQSGAFYSKRFETCVATQIDVIAPSFYIRDLTQNFLKDYRVIFQCDADMLFEANPEKVRALGGRVANVSYDDWSNTDDRSAPEKQKLSRQECQLRFEVVIDRLRG